MSLKSKLWLGQLSDTPVLRGLTKLLPMKYYYLTLLLGALGLTNCTVYTPLQPVLPTIRQAGQLEMRASLQPTLRGEASVAYSLIKYVVVTAAGSWRPQLPMPYRILHRAWRTEVGIGTYLPLSSEWTLSALGGVGWGKTDRSVYTQGIIPSLGPDFFSRYKTSFGQLSFSRQGYPFTVSYGYRLTQVDFHELQTEKYDLPLETQWRHEPFFAIRVDLGGDKATTRWQTELSGALSLSQPGRVESVDRVTPFAYETNLNRGGALLLGLGLLYRIPGRTKGL